MPHRRSILFLFGGILSFFLLTGMAVSSHASLNSLLTDTFSHSDLRNHARYTASSVNLGGGFSVSANKPQTENQTGSQWMKMGDGTRFMPGIAVPQKGSASSITRSGVSDGTLIVKNGGTDIARGMTGLQQDGLQTIFDIDKITANMELGQLAGQVAFAVVGDIALSLQRDAVQRRQDAQNRFDEAKQHNDAAGMDAAYADMQKADRDFAAWADGSAYKTMLHLAAGGLQAGFGGGNALAGALGAGAGEWVAGQTGNALLGMGASLAAGHASGSAGAGMTTAIYGDAYNRQLHAGEVQRLKELSEGDLRYEAVLRAAACVLVQCAAQYSEGSAERAYWTEFMEQHGNLPEIQQAKELLAGQTHSFLLPDEYGWLQPVTRPLFEYGSLDAAGDLLSSYQVGTRSLGLLQGMGGGGVAVAGATIAGSGAAICAETLGLGCLAAAGGTAMMGWGADQSSAGFRTVAYGAPQSTLGGDLLHQLTGISPDMAELFYGALPTPAVGAKVVNFTRSAPAVDAGIVWGKGIQGQGIPWENHLASQLPAEARLPPNFKTFDFYDDATGLATSAKTLDTLRPSRIAEPERVYQTLKGHIDAASTFTDYGLSKVKILPENIVGS